MVRRRHGWQLPAHTFQVVAITVFFLLGVAFYTFLAPFLWFQFLEFAALGLYSPLAFAVFVLYIRSSAIDPADVGVFQPHSRNVEKVSFSEGSAGRTPGDGLLHASQELSTPSRSPSVRRSDRKLEQSGVAQRTQKIHMLLGAFCAMFCGWVVKDDSCKGESSLQRPLAEEEVLFCTLCNAEVRKFSKHCRSCDKCVDGFDHHCRWLNNCVGRKNYNTFVSLMATSLSLLVLEWGVGMAVFVRCFVDKRGVEHQIVDKLGNGFSRGPFATVVAVCTLVSLLASVPLGELFFFHLILIRKGITTYEYVVAMRAQNDQQGFSAEGDVPSFPVSPSSSTGTGLSGSSSVGLQYGRGGWCTPPRIFVDHQEEVLPHLVAGQVPSTIDPDAGNMASRYSNRQKKSAIRISAWKLAKLNTDDAIRAAAKAREASSTLRQLEHSELGVGDGGYTSSTNMSSTSSISGDYLSRKERLKSHSGMAADTVRHPAAYTITDDSSVQHEPFEIGYQSSGGSPSHTLSVRTSLSPLPAESRRGPPFSAKGHRLLSTFPGDSMEAIQEGVMSDSFFRGDLPTHHVTGLSHSSADFLRAWSGPAAYSDGYEASSGESVDDGDYPSKNRLNSRERVSPDHVALSVEGGRGHLSRNRSSEAHGIGTADGSRGTNPINYLPSYTYHWLAPSASTSSNDRLGSDHGLESLSPSQRSPLTDASSLQSPSVTSGNLVYTGTSIFFGGPMSQTPVMTEGERQAPSPKPPIQLKTRVTYPTSAPELRAPGRVALRSQSPVFAPRTTLPLSLLGSPRK